jgi:hypothetical protein
VPDRSDRTIALEAADIAFADAIHHLIEQLHLGLTDSHGDTTAGVARFEGGLARAMQARELAMASIGKMIA